jgi:hypothetical protein
MKKILVALSFLFASCCAFANFQTIVELPSEYKAEQVQMLLKSIDLPQLAEDADKAVSGIFSEKVGFYFQPLIFHSDMGKPDRFVLRVDITAPKNWGKEAELKKFLVNDLLKRVPGAKSSNAILTNNK